MGQGCYAKKLGWGFQKKIGFGEGNEKGGSGAYQKSSWSRRVTKIGLGLYWFLRITL